MELHTWTPLECGCFSFDVECLAVIWLVALCKAPIGIYPSNNTYISPACKLPCLIVHGKAVASGYAAVAKYLHDNGYRLGGGSFSPDDMALMAYAEKMIPFTLWTLFCLKENYESFTRPQISNKIPFPMQYNVAMRLHQDAVKRCTLSGLLATKKNKYTTPVQNRLHRKLLEDAELRSEKITGSKEEFSITSQADTIYSTINSVISDDELTSGKVLLAAHVFLQTYKNLPKKPLEQVIQAYPAVARLRKVGCGLEVSWQVNKDATYNFRNWILSWTPASRWKPFAASLA